MIHHTVTFEQLSAIETPQTPYRVQGESPTWVPIPHKDIVSSFMNALVVKDFWYIYDPLIVLSKDKRMMSLTVPMHLKEGIGQPNLLLGIVNSNTNMAAVKMYAGVRTDTDMWMLRLPYKIMHLKSINLDEEAHLAINRVFHPLTKRVPNEVELLKSEIIIPGDAERLLMQAGREKLLPWARIGVAVSLFDKSEPSKWNLLTAFNFALRKSPANQQMEKAVKFKRMLP